MAEHGRRFDGRAAHYTRYRSRFPSNLTSLLTQHCGYRPAYVVADIGAGTGMSSEPFLAAGSRVIAVEPNPEMRAECERLLAHYDTLEVRDAAAEATGLADRSVDMVVVGRAFHWFDRERALAEFQRILIPGGWIVLLTSRRSADASDKARDYERILLEHGTTYGEVRQSYGTFSELRPFGDCARVQVEIPGIQRMTLEEFLGQTQSLSITPMPGHPKYEGMQAALLDFFARWKQEDGILALETISEVLAWQTPA